VINKMDRVDNMQKTMRSFVIMPPVSCECQFSPAALRFTAVPLQSLSYSMLCRDLHQAVLFVLYSDTHPMACIIALLRTRTAWPALLCYCALALRGLHYCAIAHSHCMACIIAQLRTRTAWPALLRYCALTRHTQQAGLESAATSRFIRWCDGATPSVLGSLCPRAQSPARLHL
jgi:hypothetical protein